MCFQRISASNGRCVIGSMSPTLSQKIYGAVISNSSSFFLSLLILFLSLPILLLLWRYPRSFTLASPMASIHSIRSWAFPRHPLSPIILKAAWTSSNHLSFNLPTFLFPSSFASSTVPEILLFAIFIKWPKHSSF